MALREREKKKNAMKTQECRRLEKRQDKHVYQHLWLSLPCVKCCYSFVIWHKMLFKQTHVMNFVLQIKNKNEISFQSTFDINYKKIYTEFEILKLLSGGM